MIAFYNNNLYYGAKCESIDENLMICKTPAINNNLIEKQQELPLSLQLLHVDYGFDLDGTFTGFDK